MNTKEGNRLIAEFMGWKKETRMWRMHEQEVYSSNANVLNNTQYDGSVPEKSMRFHKSWDWLMPVVKKIGDTQTKKRNPYLSILRFGMMCVNINQVWKYCIKFIKWYNKQRNPLDNTPTPEESPYLYKRDERYV